ncbi:MAG: hypothetical protein ACI4AD_00370 [Roseburia sp.]
MFGKKKKQDLNKLIAEQAEIIRQQEQTIASLKSELEERQEQSKQYKEMRDVGKKAISELEYDILSNPQDYYYTRNACMTPKEARIYYYINAALGELFSPKEKESYFVFPQMCLYALYNVSNCPIDSDNCPLPNDCKTMDDLPRRTLVSKSSDFVLCQLFFDDSSKQYNYRPILLIELDGASHTAKSPYGEKNYKQQIKRDAFKDALSNNLEIPLLRYYLIDDTPHHDDGAGIYKALYDFFNTYHKAKHTTYYYNRYGNYINYLSKTRKSESRLTAK